MVGYFPPSLYWPRRARHAGATLAESGRSTAIGPPRDPPADTRQCAERRRLLQESGLRDPRSGCPRRWRQRDVRSLLRVPEAPDTVGHFQAKSLQRTLERLTTQVFVR